MSALKFDGRWKSLRRDIVSQLDSPTSSDLEMVDRMVMNLKIAREATELAEATPFVEGSTGQLTEHPGFKVAHRADGQAVSYARQLRLTPFVRLRQEGSEPDEVVEDDPILRARDELAARRAARAA